MTATPNRADGASDVDDDLVAMPLAPTVPHAFDNAAPESVDLGRPGADGKAAPGTLRPGGDDRADRDLRDLMALVWDLRFHELEQAVAPSPPLDDDASSDREQRQRRGLARVRAAATRRAAQEVAAALSRLDDGSYGCCEQFEREIPGELLRAAPTGRLCIACLAGTSARGRGDDDEQ